MADERRSFLSDAFAARRPPAAVDDEHDVDDGDEQPPRWLAEAIRSRRKPRREYRMFSKPPSNDAA